MKVAVYSTKRYDQEFLSRANAEHAHELHFFEPRLTADTASLAVDFPAVCAFVNDELDGRTISRLAKGGTKLVALRSTGFNNVDLQAAERLGLTIARVPGYSPYAVAEHALGLILTMSRKFHRAYNRVREGNFALDGLLGFEVHGKTVGIVGTGKIGSTFAGLMSGFGCSLLAYDPFPSPDLRNLVDYVDFPELCERSDIVSLHCPLTPETHHLIDDTSLATMKPGVVLVNTSRGALVDARALIAGLKSGRVGHLALDVYEEEADLFFEDLSNRVIHDDVFSRLLTFPNVLITGHQGFFTSEALADIARTTLANISAFESGRGELHQVTLKPTGGQAG